MTLYYLAGSSRRFVGRFDTSETAGEGYVVVGDIIRGLVARFFRGRKLNLHDGSISPVCPRDSHVSHT